MFVVTITGWKHHGDLFTTLTKYCNFMRNTSQVAIYAFQISRQAVQDVAPFCIDIYNFPLMSVIFIICRPTDLVIFSIYTGKVQPDGRFSADSFPAK